MFAHCLECTTRYAVDLQLCPHCGSRRKSYVDPTPPAMSVTVGPAELVKVTTHPRKRTRKDTPDA
jgi:predicted  nucleic acid-binding Zn-ribbon protein